MNFQHLFTLFHPHSLIVSSEYLLDLFWSHLGMLSPATAAHSITACCSYLPTLLLCLSFWILAIALSISSVNPVTQTLTLPALFQCRSCILNLNWWLPVTFLIMALNPCLPLALWAWPWRSPFSYLFLSLALPPARSSSSTLYLHFPSVAHAKITFLPILFSYSILKDRSLRFSTPKSYPGNLSQQILWALYERIQTYIFPTYSCSPIAQAFSPVWDTEVDHFCLFTLFLTVPNLQPSYWLFF